MQEGRLSVEFPDGTAAVVGSPSAQRTGHLRILDDEFFSRVLLHGGIGLGEAYMDGLWSSDDLVELLQLAILHRPRANLSVLSWLMWPSRIYNRRLHHSRRNTQSNSRQNIGEHYDLGNDFFRLFLDETLTYSCAVFSSKDESLAEAQLNKYRALCEKVDLGQDDSVLEIGSGWGGFAIFAAQNYGCKVTTISISQEQVDLARERVEKAGLSSLVDVQFCDYRDIDQQFDKIVSIEMFEAVGAEYYETFFRQCERALRPGGRMSTQVITVPDWAFAAQRDGVNWLSKHIFPGGELPSVGAIEEALTSTTLRTTHVEDIGDHYPGTLRHWRDRFLSNLSAVRSIGFDDRFIRKWEYYLSSCEAAFLTHHISDVQLVMEKPAS